ncbi:hypothetical protein L6164_015846 [Bauhinia variegata]|uniref:Uncharacterized protein n=1 Tax=Bauhinia variegata TaxID=167791 RepID=A0ACB9NMM5_BAUVA|nr:hypothetical protein L6164_015846 [Bauhinia variegata]
MEILVGPTFAIDVSSSPPRYDRDQSSPEADDRVVPSSFLLNEVDGRPKNVGSGYGLGGRPKFFTSESSESSSSIGNPDDSDNDLSSKRDGEVGEEDEVQSKLKEGAVSVLGSLDSLEDSLPIKKGLSSHFEGKSRSFTDLSQVSTVKELKKEENPFNKRRRVQIASKWSRRSAFYSWSNPKSMPLLPVDEDEDYYCEEEKTRKAPSPSSPSSPSEEKKQEDQLQLRQNRVAESYAAKMRLRLGNNFKSRSFSLADLQEHDDEEDDDDY